MRVTLPKKLDFLLTKQARYKIAYGGRGSGKSWGFARSLLIKAYDRPLRVLCARETMRSIGDSVHQLLADQVVAMGLQEFYEVQRNRIIGKNGSLFIYGGLRNDPESLKSVEGCDVVWVEEANAVSKRSWDTLIPTIRKQGSEIWISFNPELDTDETYRRFVASPPPNSIVCKINYTDNPYLPDTLLGEAEHCKATDPRGYEVIWLGNCQSAVEGAIYEAEIRAAEESGRIMSVPYDVGHPVYTAWDLGYGDSTAIWFFQQIGYEYRVLDYLQDNRRAIDWYLRELQRKGYVYAQHLLPHDAANGQLATGMSIEAMVRRAGYNVRVVPRTKSVVNDIAAVRARFPQCVFDRGNCEIGLQGLRRYRWAKNANGLMRQEPEHDEASHVADAFRTFAVGYRPADRSDLMPAIEPVAGLGLNAWMG